VAGSPIDVNQFPLDDLLLARGLAGELVPGGSNSLVHEQSDLSRYLIGEVVNGRLDIIEGHASAAVGGPTMQAFEESVLREGGESFGARPDRQSDLLSTVARLGRTMVMQLREPFAADSDQALPDGVPFVVKYGSEEEARAVFERKKQAFGRLTPAAVVFRTEIEVEWDKFARIPIRRAD